jgi:hypothetical protein
VKSRLWVYTEDTAEDAPEVLKALVKRLLQQLSPGLPTNLLAPLWSAAPAAEATMAWHRHNWLGHWHKRRALVGELATRVTTGDIVLLHHDYDAAPGKPSTLTDQVAGLLSEVGRRAPPEKWRGDILTITPGYSIESWLYHNHGAIAGLPVNVRNAALPWLRENLHDTFGYDHIYQPKKACPLKADHNLTLATKAFPAEAAAARSPSWQATQTRLSASPPLKALLTTINPP